MASIDDVRNLLSDNGKTKVIIRGSFVKLELSSGDVVEFCREHINGVDWLVVRINGERVYQG